MASKSPSGGASPLESVALWYKCRSQKQKCMAHFYSVPRLQTHFAEKHPDEQLILPDNLPAGAMEGRIIFTKNFKPFQQRTRTFHDVSKAPETIHLPTTELEQPGFSIPKEVNKKIKCGVCPKVFKNQSVLNFHLKKEHHRHSAQEDDGSKSGVGLAKVRFSENTLALAIEVPNTVQNQSKITKSPGVIKKAGSSSSQKGPKSPSSRRRFNCQRCSKSFSNAFNLRRHLLIHSGERPHKCGTCGAAFRYKEGLTSHINRIHKLSEENDTETNQNRMEDQNQKRELPVVKRSILTCGYCPYQTKITKRFENHLKLHTEGSTSVICSLCGCFVLPRCLGFHNLSRHPKSTETSQKYRS